MTAELTALLSTLWGRGNFLIRFLMADSNCESKRNASWHADAGSPDAEGAFSFSLNRSRAFISI